MVTDGTHYTPKNVGSGVPFLTVKDVTDKNLDFLNCAFITEADYRLAKQGNSAPEPGDVLFSKDGTVGKVHVVETEKPFAVLSSLAILKPQKERIDSRYLGHALRSRAVLEDALKRKTGSAIRRVVLSDLKKVRVPLPSLQTQRQIAAILDKADELRAKRRAAMAQLDLLINTAFIDFFGDPYTNPKRFPLSSLARVMQMRGGFAFKSADYVTHGIPLIRIGEANRGRVTKEDLCYLPCEYKTKYSRFVVHPGDMLMSLTGTTGKDDYGNVMVLDDSFGHYLLNQRVAWLQPDENLLEKPYLFYLLRHPKTKGRLTAKSRGIRQANISNSDLLNLEVPLPPLSLQRKFSQITQAAHQLKILQFDTLAEMDILFASLQHRAFRGEL